MIRNVLKNELNFQPWKPLYCQDLLTEDCDHRIDDEAFFHVEKFTTVTTGHQKIRRPRLRSRKAVTVWCDIGLTPKQVAGSFILRNTMNAERYLAMQENEVWPIVSIWDNINESTPMK
ncbi:hypothetical protein ANN_09468 [Periplaneta americana]|uniref:Uncharacterized protein n=1 Tax=Periplaneta americana TaxID=6978 RepID=A0ABQ8TLE6_PERAM|nr:hypothetical protein ANN_09468 [Periplaneta americana]